MTKNKFNTNDFAEHVFHETPGNIEPAKRALSAFVREHKQENPNTLLPVEALRRKIIDLIENSDFSLPLNDDAAPNSNEEKQELLRRAQEYFVSIGRHQVMMGKRAIHEE